MQADTAQLLRAEHVAKLIVEFLDDRNELNEVALVALAAVFGHLIARLSNDETHRETLLSAFGGFVREHAGVS